MGAAQGRAEIEPLAFRVRPLAGECFESWLHRLAARHETTRKALFSHLGIETALATCDLASLADGTAERRRVIVERLAWATALPEKAILRTFVGCPRGDLLPPALRSIGCAQCWLDWLESGAQWRIERSWILRVTLRCERHDLLLIDLRGIMALGRSMAAQRLLEETVERTREQMARFTLVSTRLAWNLVISRAHLRGSEPSSYAFSKRYIAALIGNRFHIAPSRHLLLAALHSSNVEEAERMDRTFRFDAQPARGPVRRAARGAVPGLADLAAAIAAVGKRELDRKRRVLEVAGQKLEQAWLGYPAVHAAQVVRRQREVLASEVRRRYAAELASAAKSPLWRDKARDTHSSALIKRHNVVFSMNFSSAPTKVIFPWVPKQPTLRLSIAKLESSFARTKTAKDSQALRSGFEGRCRALFRVSQVRAA